ncbi:MAG: hypothetical protein HKM02_07990 [Pseudomonadales bacterium]|nr:hypothetical protein [Pseudomonadales bacterium]
MRIFLLASYSVIILSCLAVRADETSNTSPPATALDHIVKMTDQYIQDRHLSLGLGMQQGTLSLSRPGDVAKMTDNGSLSLLINANTAGHLLADWHMRAGGSIALSGDLTATANILGVNKQLLNSADVGTDIGTHVNGGFVAVAPRLSISMGPLYQDSAIYWKYSFAAGLALLHYSGSADFMGSSATGLHSVSTDSVIPAEYFENKWVLSLQRWDIIFNAQSLLSKHQGYQVNYEVFGLGLAYALPF